MILARSLIRKRLSLKKDFLLSLSASLSRVALGFVFFWQVSQALGLETLGEYLYVISALGYFGTLIDYGFNLFVLNTASRTEKIARPLFLRVMISKLVLVAVSVLILVSIYDLAFATQGLMVTTLFFAGLVLQSFSGLFIHFYKALGRFDHEFSSTLLASFLPVALLFIISGDVTILEIAWIVLVVRLAVIFCQLVLFLRMTERQGWHGFDKISRPILSRAFYDIKGNVRYAVFSVLGSIFLSIDIVIMRFVLGPEEVSIYGTAIKLLMAAILFFEVLDGVFVPRLARKHARSEPSFRSELLGFGLIMLGGGVMISVAMFLFGPTIIVLVFGDEFAQSGQLLRLLSVVLILRILTMVSGSLLTVNELQGFRAGIMVFVLPLHIGLNLLFQSHFGVWGAVYSLAFSFFLLFMLSSIHLWRSTFSDRVTAP